eukprot:gene17547-19297_t
MLNCKGHPTPAAMSFTTSIVSAIYAPIGTIGNFLLIFAILIGPLKKVRNRYHMWLISIAVTGIINSGVIDPYRAYGNYLKGMKENVSKIIGPSRAILGKVCHVNLLCSQVVAVLILTVQMLEQIFELQLKPKASMALFGVGTSLVWAIGLGIGSTVLTHKFSSVDWPIYCTTCAGSLLGYILTFCLVYWPLRRMKKAGGDDGEAIVDIRMSKQTDQSRNGTSHNEDDREIQAESAEDETSAADTIDLKMKRTTSLLLSFSLLFSCSFAAFVMAYLAAFKAVPTCHIYTQIKHSGMLMIFGYSVWSPYVFIFTLPNMRRAVLAMLTRKKVAPTCQ